jgi:SOS-response transcriptional repressor LexA
MGTIGQRIRQSRKEAGLTQEALAGKCGVSRAAVAQWEGDVTKPSLDHLQEAAVTLDVWLPWLTTGEWGLSPSLQRGLDKAQPVQRPVPVVDYFYAGKWDLITDPQMLGEHIKFITTDFDVGAGAFALTVTGESMLPEFQGGDIIIIDPEVVPKPGDFVIAKLDLKVDGIFMKYRPRGTDKSGQPIIELVPLNEDWPTQTINAENPGHIIGTLVEHRRYRQR